MDEESAQKTKGRRRRDEDNNSSTSEQSAASAKDGRTRTTKRKASPEMMTPRKRMRGSESEVQSHPEDLRVRLLKRKVKDDGEGPPQKKRRRGCDLDQDEASTSSSVDTNTEDSSTSMEEVSRRKRKRKAADDGEGPSRKKRKILELKETKEETEEDTREETKKETKKETKEETKKETKKETKEETKKETKKETKEETKKETQKETKKETKEKTKKDLSADAQRADFEAKYEQQNQLGEGGCGSVFAGYRKADNLTVAIKHIPKDKVLCKHVDENGKRLSAEVAVMLGLADGATGSAGASAPVSLLDWYDLDKELILVMERPVPSEDLHSYIEVNGGSLREEEAKIILRQLVAAAKALQDKCIFHRDIKVENILIETGSDVPRVRLIDFGLSCFVKKTSLYRVFYGTSAHVPPEWYSRFAYRAGPTTVWQMGVVLFDCLHRKSHFDTTRFLRKKLKINNRLSKNCQDFLQTCLTKAPEKRPTLEELQHHPWLR